MVATSTGTDAPAPKPDRLVYEGRATTGQPLSKRHKPQAPALEQPKRERNFWASHRYASAGASPRPYLNCDGEGRHGTASICGCGNARCRHGYAEVERGTSSHGVDCRTDLFAARVAWIRENCGFDPISGHSTETYAEITRETLYRAAHADGVIGRQGT